MKGSTAETQAAVVCKALQQFYPGTTQGVGRQANRIVVRGAGDSNAHLFRVGRVARQYAKGYDVDISRLSRNYLVVTLTKQTNVL